MWNNFEVISEEEIFNDAITINTVFRVKNGSSVVNLHDPKLKAKFANSRIAVAIDTTLIIFEDEAFSGGKSLDFGANIDCLTVSADGTFILCGLSNGSICGVHHKGIPLFDTAINENDVDTSMPQNRTFINVIEFNAEYYFCTKNGKIFKMHNMPSDEEVLRELRSDQNETDNLGETFSNNVLLDSVYQARTNTGIISYGVTLYEGKLLHIFGDEDYLFLKSANVNSKIVLHKQSIIQLQCNAMLTIFLGKDGYLYELCPYTKVFTPLLETVNVKNFMMSESNDNGIELVCLIQEPDKRISLSIFQYPNMECKFSLPVSKQIWLIDQPKSTACIPYLCGMRAADTDVMESINLCMVSESQPEKRLKTLLSKKMLIEAEEYAIKFKLDLQPVYEAKARMILHELGLTDQNNIEAVQKRFDDLISVAKMITSTEFLLQLRNLEITHRRIVKKLLQFLSTQVKLKENKQAREEINEQLLRLNTLESIDPDECDMHWQKFVQHPNIGNYCFKFLETNIPIACLIFAQHASSIIPCLKEETVLKVLNRFPQQSEPFDIIEWMRHYFPLVTEAHPKTTPDIVNWVIRKTKSFQRLNNWPDIGVEFSKRMLDVFTNVKYPFADARRQHNRSIEKLQKIIFTLEELLVLKERYNLHIHFDDYHGISTKECGFNLLQRINIRNLPDLVNNFLFKVYNEQRIDLQSTLVRYINYLIDNQKGINMWQERSVACLELIRHHETKLKCALQIAKMATVPWSDVLKPVVDLCSDQHRIAKEIQEQYSRQKVKMLLKKYGWSTNAVEFDLGQFVCRMVSVNRDELCDDMAIFKRAYPSFVDNANVYCASMLARYIDVDQAISYLNNLSEAEAELCYNKIVNVVTQTIYDDILQSEKFERQRELLKYLSTKTMHTENREHLESWLKVDALREKPFEMIVTLNELTEESGIEKLLGLGIERLITSMGSVEKNHEAYIWNKIRVLAKALSQNKLHVILNLARVVNKVELTTILAKLFLDECIAGDKLSHKMAILLIAQQFEASMSNSASPVTLAYPIANKYIEMHSQKTSILKDLAEVERFIRIGSTIFDEAHVQEYLNRTDDNDDNAIKNIFDNLAEEKPNASSSCRRDSMSVFEEVNQGSKVQVVSTKTKTVVDTLSILLHVIVHDIQPETPFNDYFKDIVPFNETINRTKLFTAIEQIIKMKQYLIVCSVLEFIQSQQKHSKKQIIGKGLSDTLYRKMLKSALQQKEPPPMLVLASMLRRDSDPDYALQTLKADLKSGTSRINCLKLSEEYNERYGNKVFAEEERRTRLKYEYTIQLRQIDGSLRDDFEISSCGQLFKDLNNKVLDVTLLKKISSDFGWNDQKVFITQIITILSTQEPDYTIDLDGMGKERIVMNVATEKIRMQCEPYIEQIKDRNLLAKQLLEFIDFINPYFYEIFTVVIEILRDINELRDDMKLWGNILVFLQHKMVNIKMRRVGELENNWWIRNQGDVGIMPKISNYRLPFLMLIKENIQDVLSEQITIQNCTEWFPLVRLVMETHNIHDMNEINRQLDTMCLNAFKQAVNDIQLNDSGHDEWNLQPMNNAFLESVLYLVSKMKDIERITLILYTLYTRAAKGADQVEAAYECYKFVMKHEAELLKSPRMEEMVKKIKFKYPILNAQHELHLYGLYDDDIATLITRPDELIRTLYNRPNLVKGDTKGSLNDMAKKLADIHGVDVSTIQTNLLKSWLSFNPGEDSNPLEQTLNDDLNATLTPTQDGYELNNDTVERAYYILKSWDPTEASNFIVNHLFSEQDESQMNTGCQLQLYECLIKLANENSDQNFLEVVEHSKYVALKCIHFLKPFGYSFTIEKFQNYDKMKILKNVWIEHPENVKALNVMTYICMGYNIYEDVIWNSVLRQMVKLHMEAELEEIIEKIAVQSKLVHSDGLVIAYEYLIRLPFNTITKTRSAENDEIMCKALFRLQSCPAKNKMKLVELAQTCVGLKQFHVAGILLALVDEGQRSTIFKILEPHRTKALRKEITELEEYGIFPFVTKLAIKLLSL